LINWALVDSLGLVLNVLIMEESEDDGYSWLQENFPGNWIKASKTENVDGVELVSEVYFKNHPGVDYVYDEKAQAFISPKPFESWILDESSYTWIPPIPEPDDENVYIWDEYTTSWHKIDADQKLNNPL
jgi:hypothetical protein